MTILDHEICLSWKKEVESDDLKIFTSFQISKSNVVDDMVQSNNILYRDGEHPDHVVVIKYVPYVGMAIYAGSSCNNIQITLYQSLIGDSKRAMDEYTSEIAMGGHNTIVIHNTCEDSLLATPLILDLVVLAELCGRIKVCSFIATKSSPVTQFSITDQTQRAKHRLRAIPAGVIIVELLVQGTVGAQRHSCGQFIVPSTCCHREYSACLYWSATDIEFIIGTKSM